MAQNTRRGLEWLKQNIPKQIQWNHNGLKSKQLRKVKGLNGTLWSHSKNALTKIGVYAVDPLYTLCGWENKTANHIIIDWMALTDRRLKIYGVQSSAGVSYDGWGIIETSYRD